MTATSDKPFDSRSILDGIRRWVEIETPTEAPEQVNKLADLVADGYRGLPATIERITGKGGCGDHPHTHRNDPPHASIVSDNMADRLRLV